MGSVVDDDSCLCIYLQNKPSTQKYYPLKDASQKHRDRSVLALEEVPRVALC